MEGQKYILDSFHFHWGSKNGLGGEHTIGKKSFSAEMHLVHYNAKYGNKDAAVKSGDPKGLAVIGILFEVRMNNKMTLKSPQYYRKITGLCITAQPQDQRCLGSHP